jgi:hypothetical protein
LTNDQSLEQIVEDQFYLAKYAGINILESSLMVDFEREAHINLLRRSIKQEIEAKQKAMSHR